MGQNKSRYLNKIISNHLKERDKAKKKNLKRYPWNMVEGEKRAAE